MTEKSEDYNVSHETLKFNEKAFLKTQFEPRSQAIKITGLDEFFDGDAIIIVRGLTASEMAYCLESKQKTETITNLLAFVESKDSEILKRVAEEMNLAEKEVHPKISLNKKLLMKAIVSPQMSEAVITKLMREQFGIFTILVNKVNELTNEGFCKKKLENIGKTD